MTQPNATEKAGGDSSGAASPRTAERRASFAAGEGRSPVGGACRGRDAKMPFVLPIRQRRAQEALAVAHGLQCEPDALSSLAYLAQAWARQGQADAALRALLYVDHHPTTLAWDRNFNRALLNALREELGPDVVMDSEAWCQSKHLDDVVTWVSQTSVKPTRWREASWATCA